MIALGKPPSLRAAPLVAANTGSSTMFLAPARRSDAATASAMAGSANMPILTASTAISEKIASICAATMSGGIGKTRVTPVVFCAVSAVTTAIP